MRSVLSIACIASCFVACSASSLCTGEQCTSSTQCDRYSACYAASGTATSGKCYVRRGVADMSRHTGQSCAHGGDCDACSTCDVRAGLCIRKSNDAVPSGHHALELERQLQQEFAELNRVQAQKIDLADRVRRDESALHKAHHSNLLQTVTLRFVLVVVASFLAVLAVILLHRFFPRRNGSRAPATAPTAPPTEAIDLSSSDDDEDVPEDEEAALLGEHTDPAAAPTSPTAELDPEDPNTCKICYDSVINCVLVCNCFSLSLYSLSILSLFSLYSLSILSLFSLSILSLFSLNQFIDCKMLKYSKHSNL